MERIFRFVIMVAVLSLISSATIAGTIIKINSASVNDNSLIINGVNFETGTIVAIGSTVLENCNVIPTEITCPLIGVLTENSSWTVRVSAGNSPHKNDEIDVYIPSLSALACSDGDFIECYSGDMTTKDVGECHSGLRTCIGGTWTGCEGEVTPVSEDTCDDNLDNDCDGDIDEGCAACMPEDIEALDACMETPEANLNTCINANSISSECRASFSPLEICDWMNNCHLIEDWLQRKICLFNSCTVQWEEAFGSYSPTE